MVSDKEYKGKGNVKVKGQRGNNYLDLALFILLLRSFLFKRKDNFQKERKKVARELFFFFPLFPYCKNKISSSKKRKLLPKEKSRPQKEKFSSKKKSRLKKKSPPQLVH